MNRLIDAVSGEYRDLAARAVTASADDDDATRPRNLRQMRAEHRRIRSRDYFHVPAGEEAAAAIERLATQPARSAR